MRMSFHRNATFLIVLTCNSVGILIGCGGSGGFSFLNPISVYLPVSTVVLMPGAPAVSIPIQIRSSSETALVSVSGLPAGVSAKYAASDTNPSGSLTFTAGASAMNGSYTLTITVMSSSQTTSTPLTLIVKST